MRATWGLLLVVPATFLCLLSTPSPASADDEAYQKAITDGVAEFDRGNWEEARTLFTQAHRVKPSARTLRGLGMVEFELRHYVASQRYLEKSLTDVRDPLTEKQRKQVEALLERARSFVGICRIELEPATATLEVDGVPVKLENDGWVLLDAGERTLKASAPGYKSKTSVLDVHGGDGNKLSFVLEKESAPSTEGMVAEQRPLPAEDKSGRGFPVLPAVLIAGGGALVLGGVVTGALALGADSDLDEMCPGRVCPADLERSDAEDASSKVSTLSTVTDVLLIGGVIVAGVGVTLLVLDGSETESPPVTAGCGPTGCAAQYRLSF